MFDLIPFRRKNVLDSLNTFFDEMEKSFWSDTLGEIFWGAAGFRTDVSDNGLEYLVEADLPGFEKEQIKIGINDNVLTIQADKDDNVEEKNDQYLRRERRFGRMSRSITLENVDIDKIKAEFKDGVLKVILPKLKGSERNIRQIDIN